MLRCGEGTGRLSHSMQARECLAQFFRVDVDFGSAGGEQFRLPGCGVGPAGNDDALAFKRPEDRQLGERRHAGGAGLLTRQQLQGIHR